MRHADRLTRVRADARSVTLTTRPRSAADRSGRGWMIAVCLTALLAASLGGGAALAVDCNNNGVDDAQDIADGTSADCNGNGVPDECDVFGVQFAPAAGSPVGAGFAVSDLTVADFDGDGKRDLAALSSPVLDGYLAVFLQTASGVFELSVCSPQQTGKSPVGLAAAKLDAGATIDLAVAFGGGFLDIGGVDILLNMGAGGCLPPAGWSPVIDPFRPNGIAAADFDGDGDVDLAVTGMEDVSVLLNDGTGAFVPAAGSPFLAETHPDAIVAGDFDGDGSADLAVTDPDANEVLVALNNGDGGFGPPAHIAVSAHPAALAAADLDGDGDLDLVSANSGGDNASILINNGGTFALDASVPAGQGPGGVAAADFDKDGHIDIAVTNTDGDDVRVLLGPSFTAGRNFQTGLAPRRVVAADMNGDGRPDLVVLNTGSGTASILLAGPPESADADHNGVPDECGGGCGAGAATMVPLMLAGLWALRFSAWRQRRGGAMARS